MQYWVSVIALPNAFWGRWLSGLVVHQENVHKLFNFLTFLSHEKYKSEKVKKLCFSHTKLMIVSTYFSYFCSFFQLFNFFQSSWKQLSMKCRLLISFWTFHTFSYFLSLFWLVRARTSQKSLLQGYQCVSFTWENDSKIVNHITRLPAAEGVLCLSDIDSYLAYRALSTKGHPTCNYKLSQVYSERILIRSVFIS